MVKLLSKICVLISILCAFLVTVSCSGRFDILHNSTDVDFSEEKSSQISFNGHVFNTRLKFSDGKTIVEFSGEGDLVSGVKTEITGERYKINHNDLTFDGETVFLAPSFLPSVIHSFLSSFDGVVIFEDYDNDKACYTVSRNVNGYFLTVEVYKNNENIYLIFDIN